MRRVSWMVVGVTVSLSCGGNGAMHVELSGKSPADGAALAAHAVCEHDAQCGGVTIACTTGGAAGGSGSDAATQATSCTGTIVRGDYDACYAQAEPTIEKLLACGAVTPDQVNTLETCFDTVLAESCVTQDEANAEARAAESGAPRPDDIPAACALLVNPPAGCT